MVSIRDYSPIGSDEYFKLTQFQRSDSRPISYEELVSFEGERGELHVNRVEITRDLAAKILRFIKEGGLSTRGSVPDLSEAGCQEYSHTVFTVRFSLHMVKGSRGGWYILQRGGREPIIANEFIEYGPKRKSGGRKNRYRRKLSCSEQNQLDALMTRTPSLEQVYRWIIRKYANHVRNVEYWFGERPNRMMLVGIS